MCGGSCSRSGSYDNVRLDTHGLQCHSVVCNLIHPKSEVQQPSNQTFGGVPTCYSGPYRLLSCTPSRESLASAGKIASSLNNVS